jgi:hypothetical protein
MGTVLFQAPVQADSSLSPIATTPTEDRVADNAPKPGDAIFLYGRARYFHAIVQKRQCEVFDKAAFDAANARFEKVRLQLAARYGEWFFAANAPMDTPIRDGACDTITSQSYSNQIGEIEQLLAKSG